MDARHRQNPDRDGREPRDPGWRSADPVGEHHRKRHASIEADRDDERTTDNTSKESR